ncbi:M20/M25/M40 family metallo-hydrolase [Granulicella sp. dw_53]|uniref:M20/M25/M40 family metallo-hydrolase n=1 Tax=Granulicella sp. dw_53 TaxID=2719792 RepID=UPI001BD6AF2C|nr:M20/M25/M40 family metallo-hydrolase [Granulicella sp. dw_53]
MRSTLLLFSGLFLLSIDAPIQAQQLGEAVRSDLERLTNTVGVSGYETSVGTYVYEQLAKYHPQRDSMGNITVTFGSGAPHRLVAAPIDEPGYVVSKIEGDGYLRVQRLPQAGLPPHYNELQNAQPMTVGTRDGKMISAVTAGLSIHLQPGRTNPPDPDDIDNLYVDMGAQTSEEVLRSGVDVLSPIAAERHLLAVGATQWSGTAVGDRFGAAVLMQLARSLQGAPLHGTTTLAFVVQQWTGSRGLTRVVQESHPDEVIYIGRPRTSANAKVEPTAALGSGVWTYTSSTGSADLDPSLQQELERAGTELHRGAAAPFIVRGYGAAAALPSRTIHLGVPLLWPTTAGETLDERDLAQLLRMFFRYLHVEPMTVASRTSLPLQYDALPQRPSVAPSTESLVKTLSLTYGISGHEVMTHDAIKQLLPPWAHPETDASGNLILRLGSASAGAGVLFMAHMDELGFRVREVLPDGTLDLENKGGGSPAFYWGHPAVIHTSTGMRGGVVMLPSDYDTAQFHFPTDFRIAAKLHVGAANAQGVADLGIRVGDTVTIPKRYLSLQGKRVSIRSLDDRVGCAALLRAVWMLGPTFKRNVTFVWSTREELGLEGASEYAATAAKDGRVPATVFALDTFVSSDSPVESKRFADAQLGKGFVIRSIDNSNIVPWKDVRKLQALAQQHKIAVQYGITGGGNDGSAFQRYGSTDVALSWPLRYAHSPAELIDLRDLEALAEITSTLALNW